MKKKILQVNITRIIVVVMMALSIGLFVGCDDTTTQVSAQTEQEKTPEPVITYSVMMYNNRGDNFLEFEGQTFDISPNKIKQHGYNSDGSWDSWYETSSVVTIEIDGNYIQTCGSTVIFKDTRLSMLEIPEEIATRNLHGDVADDNSSLTEDTRSYETYIGLKHWWYDMDEKGQHGEKLILIQSQDGYNIGAFIGNDITWEVADKLPKTTKIMIDGLPLYIHRCNFTIIDSQLLN